jgi:DNA-directed RNA polymerase subunit N (RpoN/RPB10)
MHIKPLQCGTCGLFFGKRYELNRHYKKLCEGKTPGQFKEVTKHAMSFAERINQCTNMKQIREVLFKDGKKRYDCKEEIDSERGLSYFR